MVEDLKVDHPDVMTDLKDRSRHPFQPQGLQPQIQLAVHQRAGVYE
jgi:hypothetical protein